MGLGLRVEGAGCSVEACLMRVSTVACAFSRGQTASIARHTPASPPPPPFPPTGGFFGCVFPLAPLASRRTIVNMPPTPGAEEDRIRGFGWCGEVGWMPGARSRTPPPPPPSPGGSGVELPFASAKDGVACLNDAKHRVRNESSDHARLQGSLPYENQGRTRP